MAVTIANIASGISSLSIDPAGGRAFSEVGYLSGPVTLEYSSEQEKVDVEQDKFPIKYLLKTENSILKANMIEPTLTNIKAAYGYVDTDTANTAIVGPIVPIFLPRNMSAKIVTTAPGSLTTRIILLPRLHSTGNVGTQFTKGAVQALPTEWSCARAYKEANNWVNNGTFTGNATGWTLSTFAYGTNAISITAAAGTATQAITNILENLSFTLTFTLTISAGTVTPSLGGTNGTGRTSSGTYTQSIVCGSSNTNLVFTAAAATTATIDDVYLVPDFVVGFQDA